MKEMKCLDCEKTFKAETSDEMLKILMPHYMSEHAEIMKGNTDESKKAWMERFGKEWEEAEEK